MQHRGNSEPPMIDADDLPGDLDHEIASFNFTQAMLIVSKGMNNESEEPSKLSH